MSMSGEHTAWIETEAGQWRPWQAVEGFHLEDGNSIQTHWLNLDTGARLCLIADGGWRDPERARMRLFYRSPAGEQDELELLLRLHARNGGRFELEDGSEAYVRVAASCRDVVETTLGIPPRHPAEATRDEEERGRRWW